MFTHDPGLPATPPDAVRRLRLPTLLLLLLLPFSLSAQTFSILYHEQISGFRTPGTSGQQKLTPAFDRSVHTFEAFGRQFDFALEPNAGLVRESFPDGLAELGDVRIYRGELSGIPGSWVRAACAPRRHAWCRRAPVTWTARAT